jgi:hypothetical protein
LVSQGKNAANPFGLASILTQDERKSACRKHGSDNSFHPSHFEKEVLNMNPKQRLLAIQLAEHLKANPELAERLNIQININTNKEYSDETFCCNRFRDVRCS